MFTRRPLSGERLNRFSSMIIDKIRRAVKAKHQETTEVGCDGNTNTVQTLLSTGGLSNGGFLPLHHYMDHWSLCLLILRAMGIF